MMRVREIEVNDDGKIVGLKGTFTKPKRLSYTTSKVYFWANFNLDYIGG